ncbi:MAG: helix-turn-helix transcriptional regulator [Tissierellaceae bacterium]
MYIRGEDHQSIHKGKLALAKSKDIVLECTIDDANSLPEYSLGERVLKLRKLRQFTTKKLAQKSSISEGTISNIEKSRTTPNVTTLNKLCQVLNTTNVYLLNTDSWPETTSGEIIYKYRMIRGLTQRDLAKRCNLHYSTIQDYEKNRLSNSDTLQIIYKEIGYK